MSRLPALKALAKDLKNAGEDDLAHKVACAFAALAGADRPKVELSYSYILRKLRKDDPDKRRPFQEAFLQAFEEANRADLESPEDAALMEALKKVGLEGEM